MKEGIIKFYLRDKGYGFITPSDGGKDIFFHSSGLLYDEVSQEDEVNFEVEEGRKGPQAVSIEKA